MINIRRRNYARKSLKGGEDRLDIWNDIGSTEDEFCFGNVDVVLECHLLSFISEWSLPFKEEFTIAFVTPHFDNAKAEKYASAEFDITKSKSAFNVKETYPWFEFLDPEAIEPIYQHPS